MHFYEAIKKNSLIIFMISRTESQPIEAGQPVKSKIYALSFTILHGIGIVQLFLVDFRLKSLIL